MNLPTRDECLTLTKETDAFYVSETIAEYRVKEHVLFSTRKLNMAQEWLEEII